jgi:hypothetical protein
VSRDTSNAWTFGKSALRPRSRIRWALQSARPKDDYVPIAERLMRPRYLYIGRQASYVVMPNGQIVTAWNASGNTAFVQQIIQDAL